MWKHWLAINYWCRAVLADILTFFIRKKRSRNRKVFVAKIVEKKYTIY